MVYAAVQRLLYCNSTMSKSVNDSNVYRMYEEYGV